MDQFHHLAAVMFADIVGFTSVMQTDETLALSFRDKFKNKLKEETSLHGGQIVKFSGDGALITFGSALESIRAAIAVQHFMQQEPKVPLRIGIHVADIVFEEGDVYGDGVNIASRLESMAIPGSIFISSKVRDDIKNQKEIQTVSLGHFVLKNVKEPMEIFSISNRGIMVPINKNLEGKGTRFISDKITLRKKTLLTRFFLIIVLIFLLSYLIIQPIIKKQNARIKLLPSIQAMVDQNLTDPIKAYELALAADKYISEDSALINLWPLVSLDFSMKTEPAGAGIFWKEYDNPQAEWRYVGKSPLKNVRLPRSYLRLEIRKEGYQTVEYAGPIGFTGWEYDINTIFLDSMLPDNMVRIPQSIAMMKIVGLEQEGGKEVNEFFVDKYEVTNKKFKEFVDASGYTNPAFWKYPIYSDGNKISLSTAQKIFVDKTGRPGPATWEAGTFPDGLANHPVTGISWYEAAAYASFAGKELPTIFHWSVISATSRTEFIVPYSNYNENFTVPVGSLQGLSSLGVYDLAGNAREWCFNESNHFGHRYILGGGWNDPTYSFNDSYTQPSMDRSVTNGFRCIKILPGDSTLKKLSITVSSLFRDYRKEKPVDDVIFAHYLKQFNYDKEPLHQKLEKIIEKDSWKVEKVTFNAGYFDERIQIWVFLPKDAEPPYQPVIYFPGSGDIYSKKFDPEKNREQIDFIYKSGRALIWPVYKGTHERHDDLQSDLQEETVSYKDHVIMWGKEFSRTIDYLETRPDMQVNNIGYLGFSWGGFMGGIIPAIEKRIKAVVLNVGGMEMNRALPEADQLNYLPRVTQPVLMLNGKHDMFFPVETSQKPMYDLLGTPVEYKKRIIYESGHLVPKTELAKETLRWFDQYLGPVEN